MQQPDPNAIEYSAIVTITIRDGHAWAHVEMFDSEGGMAECWKGELPITRAGESIRWAAGLGEYMHAWNRLPEPF